MTSYSKALTFFNRFFPSQHSLRERSWMLRYTYNASHLNVKSRTINYQCAFVLRKWKMKRKQKRKYVDSSRVLQMTRVRSFRKVSASRSGAWAVWRPTTHVLCRWCGARERDLRAKILFVHLTGRGRHGRQVARGSRVNVLSKTNILFMLSVNFKILNQINGNSINKFIVSCRGGHCGAPKNLAASLITGTYYHARRKYVLMGPEVKGSKHCACATWLLSLLRAGTCFVVIRVD